MVQYTSGWTEPLAIEDVVAIEPEPVPDPSLGGLPRGWVAVIGADGVLRYVRQD